MVALSRKVGERESIFTSRYSLAIPERYVSVRVKARESTLGRPKTRNNRNMLMPAMICVHGLGRFH